MGVDFLYFNTDLKQWKNGELAEGTTVPSYCAMV